MPNFSTAEDIVNTAMQELGLGRVSIASGANDVMGYQALGLLNALCEEIITLHDWQTLEKIGTFTGDGVTTTFPLPDDFGRQVNQTQWSSDSRMPMIGPVDAQTWGWLKYGLIAGTVQLRYRILNDKYQTFPAPANGSTFHLFYISKKWCQTAADATIFNTIILASGDIPQFDRRMLVAGLKAKFWGIKGFDTTKLDGEFSTILSAQKSQNQGAKTIYLSSQPGDLHLIDVYNVPDTGYGL